MPLHRLDNINKNTILGLWRIDEDESHDWRLITHPTDFETAKTITKNKFFLQRMASRALAKLCSERLEHTYSGINSNTEGAPSLVNSKLYISISHSHNFAAVIISKDPVGIDIQQLSDKLPNIVPRVCCKNEINRFSSTLEWGVVWTTKEAIYKKYSSNKLDFGTQIEVTSITENGGLAIIDSEEVSKQEDIRTEQFEDYLLTIV